MNPRSVRNVCPMLGLVLLARCSSDPPPDPCPSPLSGVNERLAALPQGASAWRCVPVGDERTHAPDDLPDPAWRALRPTGGVFFVRAGAALGGDGSRSRPFAGLDAALRTPAGSTIVLARGRHSMEATLTITDERTIVGAGTDDRGTTLDVARGTSGLVVDGSAATLTVAGIKVVYSSSASSSQTERLREIALQARGGARLTLRDVLISGAGIPSVQVDGVGSTLDADQSTVREGRGNGVVLSGGARGLLRRSVAVANVGAGVYVERSHLHVVTGQLADNGAGGIHYREAGDATGGAASCASDDPLAESGPRDCLRDVLITCNGISGLYASGARTVELWRSAIVDTRATVASSGDGLSVLGGARIELDPDLRAHAELPLSAPEPDLAVGTRILANHRAGIVVSGPGSSLDLRGSAIESNRQGGVIVQDGANLRSVQAARIANNTAVGLAMTETTTVTEITRSHFLATRTGMFRSSRGEILVGDGLSMASAAGMRVTQSRFEQSGRFGLLLSGVRAEVTDNRGDGNRYGIGNYNPPADGLTLERNRILGAEMPPATLPPVVTR